tara:strand:- start:16439 stop:16660 length:222 start_codon:yes stop_codon:yes gene_type:complete
MHFLVRNIQWGERGSVIRQDQDLPSNFLVLNALNRQEATSTSQLHFDAEIDNAEVNLVTDPHRVSADVIVRNG